MGIAAGVVCDRWRWPVKGCGVWLSVGGEDSDGAAAIEKIGTSGGASVLQSFERFGRG